MTAERRQAVTTANADRPQPSRIFIAIKIAAEIADALAQMTRGLERFQVRLVAPIDIHLTLVPPWNELSIPEAVEKLRRVVNAFDPFVLTFRHVGYGPDPKCPRLLWAECAAGHEIAELRAALLLAFGQTDERPLRPHVTLARLRGNGAIIARKHPIDQNLLFVQRIETRLGHVGAAHRDGRGWLVLRVPLSSTVAGDADRHPPREDCHVSKGHAQRRIRSRTRFGRGARPQPGD